MAEAIIYTMAKEPADPDRHCCGEPAIAHLGKGGSPSQSRIPTKFPKHNKEMTRQVPRLASRSKWVGETDKEITRKYKGDTIHLK